MPKKYSSSKALIPTKFLIPVIASLVLVAGLIVSTILGATNQDNRQQAYISAPPPTIAPQVTCHRHSPCVQQTFSGSTCPVVVSDPWTFGSCPVTCPLWGPCKDSTGSSNCGQTSRLGTQTRTCSSGGTQTQYCTIPSCSTTQNPTSCNNSVNSIQQNCSYKNANASCIVGGVTGYCAVKSGGDCTCVLPGQTPIVTCCINNVTTTCVNKGKGCIDCPGYNEKMTIPGACDGRKPEVFECIRPGKTISEVPFNNPYGNTTCDNGLVFFCDPNNTNTAPFYSVPQGQICGSNCASVGFNQIIGQTTFDKQVICGSYTGPKLQPCCINGAENWVKEGTCPAGNPLWCWQSNGQGSTPAPVVSGNK